MGFIYKVTNTVNGKVYIGQTRRDIPTRWHEHQYYSFHKGRGYNSILHAAMRKYGTEPFIIEQVEECPVGKLEERERYWIKYYNSTVNGYNISTGGKGYAKCSDEEILSWWNQGLTAKEIAEVMPLHASTITSRLKSLGVTQQEIIDRGNYKANRKKEHPVYQYGRDGNFIREFSSLREAQESIGGRRIKLSPGARERTIGGFQWRKYKTDNIGAIPIRVKKEKPPKVVRVRKPKPERKPKPPLKPVYQYTMDGDFIKEFPCAYAAARSFGMKGTGGIRCVCIGEKRHSHGYRWSYEKVDKLPPIRQDNTTRPIAQMDDNNNIIKVYEKISDAANEYGVTIHAISSVCQGIHYKCAGYHWEYLNAIA